MKVRMLVLLAVGSVLAAGAAVQGQGKADADKIQGTWTLVSMEKAGKKMPDDELKGAKLTFTKDAIKVSFGGKEEPDVSYKLDASKTPKEIDVLEKGKTTKGIYLLEGDTLKFCFAKEPGDRPKDFKAPAGSELMIMELKRDKK